MRILPITLATLLLLPPAVGTPQEDEKPEPLPADVAAIVHGEIITMDAFRGALVRRFGPTSDGKKILETLVSDRVVEAERRRRGVRISQDEVEEYVATIEKRVVKQSGGMKTLDALLKEKGVTRREFIRISRDFLVRQRMAQEDLGKDGEISNAMLGIWVKDLLEKAGVEMDAEKLPAGVWAKIGERTVDSDELGRALLEDLPDATLESALWDLAIASAIHQRLREREIRITGADVDLAIEELRDEFESDPRFRGTELTFGQYVQMARKMSLEELRKDRAFLAQVGLSKSLRVEISEDDVRAYYEKHRGRYGERRSFLHLLIRGDEKASPFGAPTRSMRDAKQAIEALHRSYLQGTPFRKLVKEGSEARSQGRDPSEPLTVTKEAPLPERLRETVFEAPKGEVVGPVRTAYGYHLVQVTEIVPAPTYEAAKGRITRDLVRERRSRELLRIRQDPGIRLRF